MVYEIPNPDETVTIGGVIYGEPWIVPKFPPSKNLKQVQLAQKSWNQTYKRIGIIFSVVNVGMSPAQEAKFRKMGGIPEDLLGDRYTLCGWKRIGYTKEYEKTHPWVNYESYSAWQDATRKRRKE